MRRAIPGQRVKPVEAASRAQSLFSVFLILALVLSYIPLWGLLGAQTASADTPPITALTSYAYIRPERFNEANTSRAVLDTGKTMFINGNKDGAGVLDDGAGKLSMYNPHPSAESVFLSRRI